MANVLSGEKQTMVIGALIEGSSIRAIERPSCRSLEALTQNRKHKKVGRPRLPRGQAKQNIVPIRFTNGEVASFLKAAKASKQTLSEWIRSTLNAAIRS